MAVIVNGSEIILSGMVGGSASGDSWFDPPGFGASDVIEALAEVGRENPVKIRLNSGGGIATEGSAINAAIMQHKGAVEIVVEGIAASAASAIAMAADTLTMAPGSVLMIHEPAGVTMGTASDHRKSGNALDALGDAYAGLYADKSGKPLEEMRALMIEEAWMTPEQAVAAGFADGVLASEKDADPIEPAAFAYGIYAKAPEKFVALANARGWKPRAMHAAPAAQPVKEIPMTEQTPAGTPPVATPPAAASADLPAVMATLASAHYSTDQMTAFVAGGGDLVKAQARLAEVVAMKDDIAKAKAANPSVSLTIEDAVARGLTPLTAMAEMWPAIVAQASIATQMPVAAPTESLMASAANAVNAENDRLRGKR